MRLNLRTVSNGLFLIFLGILLMLINYGLIGWGLFQAFINYWPVVLIVLGVGLLFNRRVPASLALLVLGLVMVTASIFAPPSQDRNFFLNGPMWVQPFANSNETTTLPINYPLDAGLTKGKIRIAAGGATINITDTGSGFAQGEVISYSGKPQANFDSIGTEGTLVIDAKWNGRVGRADNYNLKFTNKIPLDLEINAGATNGSLDFSKLKLSRLVINSGASDTKLDFGDTGMKTEARISSGASKITLSVPKGVGLKLTYSGALGNVNAGSRTDLSKNGNTYTSQNFDSAQTNLDINISSAASQIELVTQ